MNFVMTLPYFRDNLPQKREIPLFKTLPVVLKLITANSPRCVFLFQPYYTTSWRNLRLFYVFLLLFLLLFYFFFTRFYCFYFLFIHFYFATLHSFVFHLRLVPQVFASLCFVFGVTLVCERGWGFAARRSRAIYPSRSDTFTFNFQLYTFR